MKLWREDRGFSQQELAKLGRPKSETPKQAVDIRLAPDIIEAFRATGRGWQTRLNNALRD